MRLKRLLRQDEGQLMMFRTIQKRIFPDVVRRVIHLLNVAGMLFSKQLQLQATLFLLPILKPRFVIRSVTN
jgi:hypothetical protein